MTHTGAHMDWQAVIALGLVAMAAAYLARRWWPGLRGLLGPTMPASPARTEGGCGSGGEPTSFAPCNTSTGSSGCSNCGHHATPAKDHRVHIVRRPPRAGHSQQG
jgi:hypothetical protein